MGVGEETAQTVLSVSSKAAMITTELIYTLMRGLLSHMKTHNIRNVSAAQNRAQVTQNKAQSKTGKQSLKELSSKNTALDKIPVSNVDIKDFSARLKKLGIDFSVTKSRTTGEFNLFFKATDTAVIESAFQELISDKDKNNRSDKSEEKKPINEQVKNAQDKADTQNKAKAAEKAKEQQKNRSGREQDR